MAEIAADRLRTGRPPKPAEQKLSERIIVRMTKGDRTRLEALAAKEGVPLSVYLMRPWRKENA